jgi:hypothetical protein
MSDEKHSADLKLEDRDVEKRAAEHQAATEKVPLDAHYDPDFVRRTL